MTNRLSHFRSLHRAGHPLVLPNAWDAGSARLIEHAGAAAVATTSAGVAWGLGRADGGAIGQRAAVDLVARVVAAVDVPVTADIEDGYGDVAATVRAVLDAGAVGVNLEDGLSTPADHADRIGAARQVGDLFVNSRIDTYLRELGDPATRLQDTFDRAAAYIAAGADGIFVPGVTDRDTIAALAAGIGVPLNVMAGPGSPATAELAALGVARVSVGPAIALAAYAATARAARELLTKGTYEELDVDLGFAEMEALMGHPHG